MTKLWIAGYNMAGYLPEMEPAEFADFGEAVQFLAEELELDAERMADENNESAAEACDALKRELIDNAAPNREWSGTARGCEYWIKESAQ
jgi:hypothetical protein